jgi:flagellum-specific peptidoglycan hydrolase FlgJ
VGGQLRVESGEREGGRRGRGGDVVLQQLARQAGQGSAQALLSRSRFIARRCCESGLTRPADAFFGVKAGSRWRGPLVTLPTKEEVNGKLSTMMAAFRKYPTPEAAFADRVALLRLLPRYHRLFRIDSDAAEAQLLKDCCYATDSQYPQKLVAIINRYNLTRIDS